VIKAVEDLGRVNQRDDARAFFDSPYLDWYADALDLRPARIRQRVAEGIDPRELKYARRAHKNERSGAMAERAKGFKASGEA
jgi:hypothetical protein